MAAVSTALPEVKPEKLVIKSTGYAGIGVGGVERMRITSSGHVMIHGNIGMANNNPSQKLNINR